MSENGVDWRRLCWHLLAAQRILLDGLAREAAVLQGDEERSIGGEGQDGNGADPEQKPLRDPLVGTYDAYEADLEFLTQEFLKQGFAEDVAKAMAESELRRRPD